jgi:hypothetical protein
LDWCEKNELNLTAANQKKEGSSQNTWDKQAFLEQAIFCFEALDEVL